MSFKIPKLKRKPPDKYLFSNLEHFEWNDISEQTQLGLDSHSLVNFVCYQRRDVVLKIPSEITVRIKYPHNDGAYLEDDMTTFESYRFRGDLQLFLHIQAVLFSFH